MQRKRLYDPPADDEINYYILMKKYVRSLISFFDAPDGTDYNKFGYYSPFNHFYHMDVLTDLKENMVDLLEFVSELDIRNGSAIKPLMGIKDNAAANSLFCGSKERTNQFYRHKFYLASLDVHSSESAFLPPPSEERQSYLQVFDHLASSSLVGEPDEVNVYSDELYKLFLKRIESVMSELKGLPRRIIHLLVEKLSLSEWESIYSDYMGHDLREKQRDEALKQWRKKMVEKYCQILSEEELPAYIACIDRCLHIAYQTGVSSLSRIINYRRWYHTITINSVECAALHSLTLLEPPFGSSFGTLLREQAVLRNRKMIGKTVVPVKLQQNAKWMNKCVAQGKEDENDNLKLKRKAKWMSKCIAQGMEDENGNLKLEKNAKWMSKCVAQGKEDENENVHLLKGIIKVIKHIGDSSVKLDKEETQLLNKIWQNIAASVHFFKCAMAYEQRYYVAVCGGLPDDIVDALKTCKRRKTSGDVKDISSLFWNLYLPNSFKILKEYKVVLTEKLEGLPKSVETDRS